MAVCVEQGEVKLSGYGLYFMTGCGVDVDFPIGYVAICWFEIFFSVGYWRSGDKYVPNPAFTHFCTDTANDSTWHIFSEWSLGALLSLECATLASLSISIALVDVGVCRGWLLHTLACSCISVVTHCLSVTLVSSGHSLCHWPPAVGLTVIAHCDTHHLLWSWLW